MIYSIFGPYEVLRNEKGNVCKEKKLINKNFWNEINAKEDGLPNACGCYLFALRISKGIVPFYVGCAKAQSFKEECFGAHKINIYNDSLGSIGTPVMFLVAKQTAGGKFAKLSKTGHLDIDCLETLLIGSCIKKNPKLANNHKTKILRNIIVPGFLNAKIGKPKDSTVQFMRAVSKKK